MQHQRFGVLDPVGDTDGLYARITRHQHVVFAVADHHGVLRACIELVQYAVEHFRIGFGACTKT